MDESGGFPAAHSSRTMASFTTAVGRDPVSVLAEPITGHTSDDDGLIGVVVDAAQEIKQSFFPGDDMIRELKRIARILDLGMGGEVWANTADVSNQAMVAYGAQYALGVFTTYTGKQGALLRNIQVGASGAAIIQLVKVRGSDGAPLIPVGQTVTIVGTLRIVAGTLSAVFAGVVLLQPGEQLHAISSANVSLDFSADYRMLRTRE